ncbi:MAG: 6-phosphofructokinase [Candidatus Humimicrobiaceae bacterium]
MRNKSIGILTSGGDCGGLNSVIKGAAEMAHYFGMKVYIIPNGYAGLYNLYDSGNIVELNDHLVDSISSMVAGSEAGNSRVKIPKIHDINKYKKIKAGLSKYAIDCLVISGGDDTGSVVVDLAEKGVPCIHVPKTMDLDLQIYSVGGDSAINRIAQFVEQLKTTGRSHNRIMIVEVFGRYAGHTAFRGGIAADADCILIPEVPINFDIIYEHMKERFTRRVSKSTYKSGTYLIVVSEGLTDFTGEHITENATSIDSFGHKKLGGTGKFVRSNLTDRMKQDIEMEQFMKQQGLFVEEMNVLPEIREAVPSYLIRSGITTALDANFGKDTGAAAVVLIEKGITGVTVVGVNKGTINYIKTQEAIKQRFVDLNMISFYESMGICFGRKPEKFKPKFEEIEIPTFNYV